MVVIKYSLFWNVGIKIVIYKKNLNETVFTVHLHVWCLLNSIVSTDFDDILQLRSLRAKVEEARSSMQAARSKGKVIDSLMALKKSGQMPGLYGRLVCWSHVD